MLHNSMHSVKAFQLVTSYMWLPGKWHFLFHLGSVLNSINEWMHRWKGRWVEGGMDENSLMNTQINPSRYAQIHGWSGNESHLDKVVVNPCSIGQEEAAARGHAIKEKELLLSTQQAMVPLLRLLHPVLVCLHAVLVREGDAIHTLQTEYK